MKARRTLHHLRDTALDYTIIIAPSKGAVKLEATIQDHMAKEQTVTALNYIHLWSRMQEQIKSRRLHMLSEARIKQKKLENQLKLAAKIHELQVFLLSPSSCFLIFARKYCKFLLRKWIHHVNDFKRL